MKVSDYVIDFLVKNDIDKVFGYIGKNMHLCDSIDRHQKIENVFTAHEQGAGFAANAYARVTGKTGVATATSGPGGTNFVTPIADCYFDSVPVMFIIGDVPLAKGKDYLGVRQFEFQETDIVAITKPITKYSVIIKDLYNLRYELEKAYYISQEGRKGPVLIALPENFQYQTNFDPNKGKSFFDSEEYNSYITIENNIDKQIEEVTELISKAKRPVVLVGGGVQLSGASLELKEFLKQTNIPMVFSLMGNDAITNDYKYNMGFIGNFANRYANLTLANADLVIVLGSRLDPHQTGTNISTFLTKAKIIQVDIDKNELGLRLKIDVPILADIKRFLKKLNKKNILTEIEFWQTKVLNYKEKYPAENNIDKTQRVGNTIISKISQYLKDDDIICIDVGQHQMLAAQSLKLKGSQRALYSGGFASMGFALPAAIGATIGTGKRAIVISGDGGFQMNIQELEVIKRRNLPIKMFIINNAGLHMITLRQDTFLEANHTGSKNDYSVPSFKKIANAYGIKGLEVSDLSAMHAIIENSLKTNDSELIDIQLEASLTTVEPRLSAGHAFEDMYPYLDKAELKEQMLMNED